MQGTTEKAEDSVVRHFCRVGKSVRGTTVAVTDGAVDVAAGAGRGAGRVLLSWREGDGDEFLMAWLKRRVAPVVVVVIVEAIVTSVKVDLVSSPGIFPLGRTEETRRWLVAGLNISRSHKFQVWLY